jgi:hypothetical protein
MLTKFWETVGQDLAKKWLERIFGPAFLFWGGGLGLYLWQEGWAAILADVEQWPTTQQIGVLILGLLLIVFSSLLMETLRLPLLRLLEGYWPRPFHILGRWITDWRRSRYTKKYNRLRELKALSQKEPLATADKEELIRLELWAHAQPASARDLLPTAFGNLLRAREQASWRKYGLDAIICWPRLWTLLPDTDRDMLVSARTALNTQAEMVYWGFFFLAWAVVTPWAIPIAMVWMGTAYATAVQGAATYGDLVEAAFDLHRWRLYETLRWPLPLESGKAEIVQGEQLTEFLWRGTGAAAMLYRQEESKSGESK